MREAETPDGRGAGATCDLGRTGGGGGRGTCGRACCATRPGRSRRAGCGRRRAGARPGARRDRRGRGSGLLDPGHPRDGAPPRPRRRRRGRLFAHEVERRHVQGAPGAPVRRSGERGPRPRRAAQGAQSPLEVEGDDRLVLRRRRPRPPGQVPGRRAPPPPVTSSNTGDWPHAGPRLRLPARYLHFLRASVCAGRLGAPRQELRQHAACSRPVLPAAGTATGRKRADARGERR